MDTLETRELLGYKLETFSICEFKEYYDTNKDKFTSFALNAFLKALSIPPSYFLEQPVETQEELLINKLALVKMQSKYKGFSILVISNDNQILNATKIKSNEIEVRFEYVSSIEDVENVTWNRTFIKDGYINGFILCKEKRNGFNRALFIDLPLLFNKSAIIHEGFIELANPNMSVEKDMIYYTNSNIIDYEDFQHIKLAIEEAFVKIKDIPDVNEEQDKIIYRDPMEVICNLADMKVIPKSLIQPIYKYVSEILEEKGEQIFNTSFVLNVLMIFDNNVKSLKQVNALRESKTCIDLLYESNWQNKLEQYEIA